MAAGGNLARSGNRRARNMNRGRGPGNIAGLGMRRTVLSRFRGAEHEMSKPWGSRPEVKLKRMGRAA